MAKLNRTLGPFRYHIPDNAPFFETRMSVLWRAEALDTQHRPLGEKVVLKVARLKEELFSLANQRAIENEVRWLRQMDHPGIIKLRPIAEEGTARPGLQIYQARSSLPGEPWFVVTDYLPGGTLLSLVEDRKKLTVNLALQIAHSLAETLAYVHAQGCIHRDFKPQNILFAQKPAERQMTAQSRPILIDFGIANHRGDQQLVSGTKPWLAPECDQAMRSGAKLAATPSMDMYALGLTLYFMLTGKRPPDAMPNLAAQLFIQPADLVDVAPAQRAALATALNTIIHTTIADDPNKRLSAQQFAAEVQRLLPPSMTSGAAVLPWLAQRWAWVSGIAAAVALGYILIYTNAPPPPSAPPTEQGAGVAVVAIAPAASTPTPEATSAATNTTEPASTATTLNNDTNPPTPDVAATVAAEVERGVALALTGTASAAVPPTAIATPVVLVATATDTSAPTPVPTTPPTSAPTQTPSLPSPTATPVATQASAATSTPRPTNTPTIAPTATNTSAPTPTRAPTPLPATVNQTVTLVQPLNSSLSGPQTFSWATDIVLAENQAFEMVFWEVGQEPVANGFSPPGAVRATSVTIDLDRFAASEQGSRLLIRSRRYQWGVLLVETSPFKRLRHLGGAHTFVFGAEGSSNSGNGSSGSNNDGSPAEPPSRPPDTATPRG